MKILFLLFLFFTQSVFGAVTISWDKSPTSNVTYNLYIDGVRYASEIRDTEFTTSDEISINSEFGVSAVNISDGKESTVNYAPKYIPPPQPPTNVTTMIVKTTTTTVIEITK